MLASCEEPIARDPEAFPDGFFLTARHWTDRFPLGLKPLDLFGRGNPVRRFGQRFGALAQRHFPGQIRRAFFSLRGEMRFAARPDDVMRGLEAAPERVGLRARHVGRQTPLLLQIADLAGNLFGIRKRLQRLHPRAQLLLHGDVREASPFVGLAQLLCFRSQRRLRRFQPTGDVVEIAPRRQGGNVGECRPNVAQRMFGRLDCQIRFRDERLHAARQLVQPGERLAAPARVLLLRLGVASGEARFRVGELSQRG